MRTIDKVSTIVSCMALALAIICGPPSAAAATARGQGVTDAQLPEELRAITVQRQFIPGQGVPIGMVQNMRGHLIVRRGNDRQAFFAAEGDDLYAHDDLFTLEESRVRVRFSSADIVNMGADSRIRVDELVDDRQNGEKKTRLSMLRGKAMFYVMRLLKYNKVDTEVHTPTAVCGVRGTKFGVIVQKKTGLLSSRRGPIYLAAAPGMPLNLLLADNGAGGGTETIMIMEEGSGFMTAGGTTAGLESGQTGTAGPTGPPATGPTDPNLSQALNNETDPGVGGGSGSGGGGGDNGEGTSGTSTTGDAGDDSADTASTITQQGLTNASPTHKIGYFAAMLTRNEYGTPLPDNVFISTDRQDYEGPDILGTAITGGGDIVFNGRPGEAPTASRVVANWGVPVTNLGPQHQVQATRIGHNQFLEWGYWIMPAAMTSGSAIYVIDNPGVYVHGDPTPSENLAGIFGHYTGTAWGTLWNDSGGSKLTGTMTADVAMGGPVLKNLGVSATNGTNTVTVHQTSDIYIYPPGGFNLDSRNADFKIDGNYANGRAIGGFYGPNGEALGGSAAMSYGSGNHAVLGFEGKR
ncbi:MAG: FecR family protein [Pseudomonadota bacterium]